MNNQPMFRSKRLSAAEPTAVKEQISWFFSGSRSSVQRMGRSVTAIRQPRYLNVTGDQQRASRVAVAELPTSLPSFSANRNWPNRNSPVARRRLPGRTRHVSSLARRPGHQVDIELVELLSVNIKLNIRQPQIGRNLRLGVPEDRLAVTRSVIDSRYPCRAVSGR